MLLAGNSKANLANLCLLLGVCGGGGGRCVTNDEKELRSERDDLRICDFFGF